MEKLFGAKKAAHKKKVSPFSPRRRWWKTNPVNLLKIYIFTKITTILIINVLKFIHLLPRLNRWLTLILQLFSGNISKV